MDTGSSPRNPEGVRRKGLWSKLYRLKYVRVPWYGLAAGFCAILLMGWLLAGQYDRSLTQMRVAVGDTSDLVFQKEQEILHLSNQVRLAKTDQYIITEARTKYGYLFPGEIRFVVTNPEVLGIEAQTESPGEGVEQP
jgi:hypothetical protein